MPDPKVFSKLGLLLIQGFLDRFMCDDILQVISGLERCPATIRFNQGNSKVDESIRNVGYVNLPEQYDRIIQDRMRSAIAQIESHLSVNLKGFERPQYLIYGKGSFYSPHRDAIFNKGTSILRSITVVIFLNDEGDSSKSFQGGRLTFYGLLKEPNWERCGLPLKAEAGTLVAFPSDLVHEVTPVTSGERYTIVTWYY